MALGANFTEIVQLALGVSEVGQLGVAAKSATLAPVTEMVVIFNGVVPKLVKVAVFVALVPTFSVPNFSTNGLKPAIGFITLAVKLTC